MLRLLLAFVLVVMAMGKGCCPPKAWEGFVGTMSGFMKDGKPHSSKGLLMYHTNDTLGMVDSEGDIIIDRLLTLKIRIIKDNNKMIGYNIMNGKCTKKTLVRKELDCIPENATLVRSTYLGAGPETLAVKVYRFMDGDTEVYSTVTSSGCIPLDHVLTGIHPDTKAEFIGVEQVSGITVGVKDPSVFDIPSICPSSGVSSDYVTTMSLWMSSVVLIAKLIV
ncbi:hypothetical protein ACJMK2_008066 [Sinanodonta woodiana]|uniref:Uncharacterized protein n=1 Tax=Sinanodonta woodiana TaxID=1069815 RepID=A0ABD3VKF3_SINWO